jgi:hypothetical protein
MNLKIFGRARNVGIQESYLIFYVHLVPINDALIIINFSLSDGNDCCSRLRLCTYLFMCTSNIKCKVEIIMYLYLHTHFCYYNQLQPAEYMYSI